MGVSELRKLPNIGKKIEEQLLSIAINDINMLKEVGSQVAWLKIREVDPTSWSAKLLALEGAIQGVNIKNINENDRKKLKQFYKNNKL